MKEWFDRIPEKISGKWGILFFAITFLLTLWAWNLGPQIQDPLLLTFGRWHPLVLHFPLVLICILFLATISQSLLQFQLPKPLISVLYIATLFFTLLSLVSGFLLWSSGAYAGTLPDDHFKGAMYTYGLLILSLFLYHFRGKLKAISRLHLLTLLAAVVAVFYTGHLGGNMTHGTDFLTAYLPLMTAERDQTIANDSTEYLYEDIVYPILEVKCAGCHSTIRTKGGFSVATLNDLFQKGESGKSAVIHSFPDSSELYRRLILPDTLDEHMPPKGKNPLERKEIEIVKYWILEGAKPKQELATLPDSIKNTLILQLAANLNSYKFDIKKSKLTANQIEQELQTLAFDLELSIKKDSSSGGNLYMLSNLFPPSPFNTKKLLAIRPFFKYFSKVSLASTSLDNADLYYFSDLENVRELYLQKTNINCSGLIYLKKLPNLEKLNISFTDADDQFLLDLLNYPAIKEVYLYSTKTSYPVIKAVESNKKGLKIYTEEGPYF